MLPYKVDWVATGTMLSGIGSLTAACAILAAAVIGRFTFNQWRRQKSEERRIDLAEKVLTSVYRCRGRLNYARSSLEFQTDRAEAEKLLRKQGALTAGTSDEQLGRMISAQIVITRLAEGDDWKRLDELGPVAKAIFGDCVVNQIRALQGQRSKVIIGARRFASDSLNAPPHITSPEAFERYQAKYHEIQNRMWNFGTDDEPDEVNTAIEAAIAALESQLLPIIRAGS